MDLARFVLTCSFVALLAACGSLGGSDAQNTEALLDVAGDGNSLTFTGATPAAAENKMAYGRLLGPSGNLVASANSVVSGGGFSLGFATSLANAAGSTVAVYIDINGDKVCNIAPTDVGGSVVLSDGGNTTLTLTSAAQAPCSLFGDYALTIGGNDFTPHNNEMIYAAVRDTASNAYVTTPMGSKVLSGVWQTTFPSALVQGRTYAVAYFADIAGDKQCQNHSWLTSTAAATQNISLNVSHDMAQTAVCTNFPAMSLAAP